MTQLDFFESIEPIPMLWEVFDIKRQKMGSHMISVYCRTVPIGWKGPHDGEPWDNVAFGGR